MYDFLLITMKFSDNVYFTVDIIDNHFNLSPYFVNTYQQFFATFHAFNVREDEKFIRYEVNATVERDCNLNKYEFFLVYNKNDDYYVLLNRGKCTVLNIQDEDSEYSIIEQELMNVLLVQLFGYIPRFFFDEDENKVYSKIAKYLNNRIQRYIKKYDNIPFSRSGEHFYNISEDSSLLLNNAFLPTSSTDLPTILSNTSFNKTFTNSVITNYGNIGNWDTSNVTDMSYMFLGSKINKPLENWNTSNVMNMKEMFWDFI